MKRILLACCVLSLLAITGLILGGLPVRAESAANADAELSAAIARLSVEQKAALLVLVKGIVDAQNTGASPTDAAMKAVSAYVEAAEAGDLDTLMEQIADDFSHYEVGDKIGYRGFLDRVKADGMLEDIKGNTADAKAVVKGDTVVISPVELEGIFGTVTMEFELRDYGGSWRIFGMEMSGV